MNKLRVLPTMPSATAERYRLDLPGEPLAAHYPIGLVITTYNRPHYLARCLQSLRRSRLTGCVLMVVDDGSTDERTLHLIRQFAIPGTPVIKAYRTPAAGCYIHENLQFGWDYLHQQVGCTYLANLDPDTLVKRAWLTQLQTLYTQMAVVERTLIVTGFTAYQHPVAETTERYYRKASIGGLNLFFAAKLYAPLVRPTLTDFQWDLHLVAAMQAGGYAFFCTRPSVIQHIGRQGLWSGPHGIFDFAIDYWGTNPYWMHLVHWHFRARRRLAWWGYRLRQHYFRATGSQVVQES